MKKYLLFLMLVFCMAGCAKTDTTVISVEETLSPVPAEAEQRNEGLPVSDDIPFPQNTEDSKLKFLIDNTEISVTWESCAAVKELMADAANGDIVVGMSMYGGWEQVGSLGHSYPREDRQMTAVNGDIVLYSGDQIVVFYGDNSWSYTKLGKMNLSEDEVTALLSKGNVTLTIRK